MRPICSIMPPWSAVNISGVAGCAARCHHWSDRGYACEDLGGHNWWFYQRMRSPKTS